MTTCVPVWRITWFFRACRNDVLDDSSTRHKGGCPESQSTRDKSHSSHSQSGPHKAPARTTTTTAAHSLLVIMDQLGIFHNFYTFICLLVLPTSWVDTWCPLGTMCDLYMLLHEFQRLLVEGWGSETWEGAPPVPQELGSAVTKHTEPHSRLETKARGVLDAALVPSPIFTASYTFT